MFLLDKLSAPTMATVQDLMCYQINKFHRTTMLHPPGKVIAPAPFTATATTAVPPAPVSVSQPSSPTIKASTQVSENTEPNRLKTACSCKCQSSGEGTKCAAQDDSGSLELVQYSYCPDCERETKKSRTLRFGSGGDVFVDKSHHTYYNTLHPPPLPPPPSATTTKSSNASASASTARVNVNAKDDQDDDSSSSTLTVNINLPKRFDFKLLANQSHHLHVNISISENKNSKQRGLASLPSSPNAISRAGRSNEQSSHSFTFTAGHLHSSSSCGHINELNKDWAKHDIRHNLHLSGWYFGKMDWQDSIRVLKPTPIGTFLLRDSGDPKHCFSLSIQTEHGPISSRISCRNGKFRLDSQDHVSDMLPSFPNVIALVEHYIKFGLVKNPSGRQVWVDSHGLTFSPIHLREPKKKFVPSLQHMSRLVINRHLDRIDISRREVPPTIQNYLNKYPHTV